VLDTSWTEHGTTVNELGFFDLGVRACPVWEVARVPNPSPVVRALQRLRPSGRPFLRVLAEKSHDVFEPEVLSAPDDTYLLGFWQFEEYFAEHESRIREAFTFPPLAGESERVANEIGESLAVGMHVRRGDYASHDLFEHLDAEYYARAADTVADAVGEIRVFVFSDDPRWCAEELAFEHETMIVDRSLAPDRHWEDLALMTLCHHHVIANSSYGWWGAWLSPSQGKVVVAPRRWVRGEYAADPVPARWLRV
jgi:alkanesulfonate monooxygenase SsuD/methylene tetrahydromethanopterin reductase-like flavin-dependent oxidoreductase (luciferase family)